MFSFSSASLNASQKYRMYLSCYSLHNQETASWTQSPAQTVDETDQNHSEKQIVWNLRQQPNPKEKDR